MGFEPSVQWRCHLHAFWRINQRDSPPLVSPYQVQRDFIEKSNGFLKRKFYEQTQTQNYQIWMSTKKVNIPKILSWFSASGIVLSLAGLFLPWASYPWHVLDVIDHPYYTGVEILIGDFALIGCLWSPWIFHPKPQTTYPASKIGDCRRICCRRRGIISARILTNG